VSAPSTSPVKTPFLIWLATTAGFIVSVLLAGARLPERVAVHFNAAGQPDDWMHRSTHLATFIGLGLGVSAFIIGIIYSFRFFPADTLNVPNAPYWRAPANYPRACAFMLGRAFWYATLLNIGIAWLHALLAEANRATPPMMPNVAPFALLIVLGTAAWAWSIWRFFKRIPAS
jgi:uncharacterized membrane protein